MARGKQVFDRPNPEKETESEEFIRSEDSPRSGPSRETSALSETECLACRVSFRSHEDLQRHEQRFHSHKRQDRTHPTE